MSLKELRLEDMEWIHLAWDMGQLRALVGTVLKFRNAWKSGCE